MNKKLAFYLIVTVLVVGFFLFAGCNPAKSPGSQGSGNPKDLRIAGYEKNGAPRLEKTKTPLVIMFTGDF